MTEEKYPEPEELRDVMDKARALAKSLGKLEDPEYKKLFNAKPDSLTARLFARAEKLDAVLDLQYCNYMSNDEFNSKVALLARKAARIKRERKQAARLKGIKQ